MITERTLRKWRREALTLDKVIAKESAPTTTLRKLTMLEICNRILRMTQELLDQHLLRKETK